MHDHDDKDALLLLPGPWGIHFCEGQQVGEDDESVCEYSQHSKPAPPPTDWHLLSQLTPGTLTLKESKQTHNMIKHFISEMRETGKGNHPSPVGNWSENLFLS